MTAFAADYTKNYKTATYAGYVAKLAFLHGSVYQNMQFDIVEAWRWFRLIESDYKGGRPLRHLGDEQFYLLEPTPDGRS